MIVYTIPGILYFMYILHNVKQLYLMLLLPEVLVRGQKTLDCILVMLWNSGFDPATNKAKQLWS